MYIHTYIVCTYMFVDTLLHEKQHGRGRWIKTKICTHMHKSARTCTHNARLHTVLDAQHTQKCDEFVRGMKT